MTITSVDVREVTSEEVEHFHENGWVLLRGLLTPVTTAELLERAKGRMGENADQGAKQVAPEAWRSLRASRAGTANGENPAFVDYYEIDRDDDLFAAVRLHPQMGRNASLLYGRDMPIRSLTSLLAAKMPAAGEGPNTSGRGETAWHQDNNTPIWGYTMAVWIALDEITPEMGSMQFRNGSHKLGLLAPPVTAWPRANELPISEPNHLQPGDATVHHQYVVHSAPRNTADAPRWAFIINYFAGDAPYMGSVSRTADQVRSELAIGKPLDHARFPVVWQPAGE